MKKNNFIYVFILITVFNTHNALGMDLNNHHHAFSPRQSTGCSLGAPEVRRRVDSPKSLLEYFNLSAFKHAPEEVKNLVAKQVIGAGGWWYKKVNLEHSGRVRAVAFNPQGTMLATGSEDKTVCLWDIAGNKLHALQHDDFVEAVAFESENLVGTISGYYTVCLWDLEGNIKAKLSHNHWVNAVAFYPQGNRLATASRNTARLWDLEGNRLHTFQHDGLVVTISFNPQSTVLATGSEDHRACLWDLEGNKLHTLQHGGPLVVVGFHPQGTLLASGSYDKTAYLWDSNTGSKLHTFQHNAWVRALAFNPQGTMLATGSEDKTVCLWDLEGNKLHTLQHNAWVKSVSFDSQGKMLATSSGAGEACVWDSNTGNKLPALRHKNCDMAVAYQQGDLVGTASGNIACLWERYHNPTLEQVLLREVYKKYFIEGIVTQRRPEIECTSKDDLVPWMAKKFKLKQDELQEVWNTVPDKLQTSIVATLLYRAAKIAHEKK